MDCQEEKQLREMVQAKRRLNEIAAFLGKSPKNVKKKKNRLNLKVVVLQIPKTTTSNDLPSVEKALQKLNDALVLLETHSEVGGCLDFIYFIIYSLY